MKFLIAKVADKVNQFFSTGIETNTFFMDPSEIIECRSVLKNVQYITFGGYEAAERKVIFIGNDEIETNNAISVVRVTANSGIMLSHRSVLGSLIGLGMKRELIGDILINENFCDIIVMRSVVEFILNNLKYIGREKVTVSEITFVEMELPKDLSKEIRTTVKSLRVDAIISAGFGIPREKSSILIKSEAVKINHVVIKSQTKLVKEGDLISVRGKGRLEVSEILGQSRSDRIKIVLKRK